MKTQFGGQKITSARFVLLLTLMSFHSQAQSYHVDWFKASGGGGTSTNGRYSVIGTIGQVDASGPMVGGGYSVSGGFWSFINVVQTAGLPTLAIRQSGNSIIVYWPAPGNYTLQQSGDLSVPSGWSASGYAITTANGTNSVIITSPAGDLFFRLSR